MSWTCLTVKMQGAKLHLQFWAHHCKDLERLELFRERNRAEKQLEKRELGRG